MTQHSILAHLAVVGPFACGVVAMAVTRDLWWLLIGLAPAVAVGLREWIHARRKR